jgi:RNA recognition motif-containing protein
VSQRLFVGNLSYNANESEIKDFFTNFGEVTNVNIIKDRDTGRSKGFAFVDMQDITQALTANGTSFLGRNMVVNQARERSR